MDIAHEKTGKTQPIRREIESTGNAAQAQLRNSMLFERSDRFSTFSVGGSFLVEVQIRQGLDPSAKILVGLEKIGKLDLPAGSRFWNQHPGPHPFSISEMATAFDLEAREGAATVDLKYLNRIRLQYYSIEDRDREQINAHQGKSST